MCRCSYQCCRRRIRIRIRGKTRNAEFLMTPLENASPQQCHDCTYKDDTLTHARNRSWFFLQYFIKIYKTDSAKNETTKETLKSHFRFGRQCSSRSFRLCSAVIQSAGKYIVSQPFVKSFLGHVSLLQGNHTLHLVFSRFARFTGVSFCVTSALSASFVHVVFLEDNIDQYRPLGCFLSKNIDQYRP